MHCWGLPAQGGVSARGDVPAQGVSLPGGVYLPGGVPARGFTCQEGVPAQGSTCLRLGKCPGTPPVNRMTDRCKNITLPQTSFAGGNNEVPHLVDTVYV